MREHIKKYLPYFQFGAVVMTIVLGVHTALDRYIEPSGDAIRFIRDSFTISQVNQHGHENHWEVTYKKIHLRKDCKLFEQTSYIEDWVGFRYQVRTTALKQTDPKLSPYGQEPIEYKFHFVIENAEVNDDVTKGVNRFGGTKNFKCTNGNQVIEFPQVDGLLFRSEPKASKEHNKAK